MRSEKTRERIALLLLLLSGAVVFCAGITWGLPSRDIDRYLFGDREVWTGERIHQLAGDRPPEGSRGADVDATPVARSSGPTLLNGTDEQRARILLRYRLYTYQPDEMITMMSLARMRPAQRDFDPRLYQYGGFWIYSVGALLFLTGKLGLIHLTHDLTYYLDHPEAFARFYLVARLWSAAWGLVGILAVCSLTRSLLLPPLASRRLAVAMGDQEGSEHLAARIEPEAQARGSSFTPPNETVFPAPAARTFAPLCAAATFLFLPVVINMAHEAKPHLAAAVLMLLAVLPAARYVETGCTRCALFAGALCGLSFGTVLSAFAVFIILPLMALLRPDPWRRRGTTLPAALLIGVVACLMTNPYILINFVFHRDVLFSNLRNSTAMYAIGGWFEGASNIVHLLTEAASPIVTVLAVVILAAVLALKGDRLRIAITHTPRDPRVVTAILLAAPALLILLQFCSLAAGKPGEYGRFLVYPATVLVIAAIAGVEYVHPVSARRWQIILVLSALVFGARYDYAFVKDTLAPSRLEAAEVLAARPRAPLVVPAEPAPYNMPPFNLFTHELLLDPQTSTPDAGRTLVMPVDDVQRAKRNLSHNLRILFPNPPRYRPLGETIITWADKPILIVSADVD